MALIYEPRWKSYVAATTAPVFTPQQCDDVIRIGQKQKIEKAGIGPGFLENKNKNKSSVDKKIRVTKIGWIPFSAARPMYIAIERWMLNTNANHFGFEGMQITEAAQYTEYSKGCFYDWHQDSSENMANMPPVRKISMTLLLNDPKEFKGGELELTKEGKSFNLKRGYAIFFASFLRHRIKRFTKGNRKSLVMWFGGPPLK